MAFVVISIPFFLCGAATAALALFAWRRGSTTAARPFVVFMLLISVYILGYAMELNSPDMETALFWNKLQYLGILTFPSMYLVFVSEYVGLKKWLTRRNVALLFALPAILILAKIFDDQFHLIYASVGMQMANSIRVLVFTRGPLYLPATFYHLSVFSFANYLLLQKRRFSSQLYRTQTAIMLLGAVVVYLVFIIYLLQIPLSPALEGIDFNAFAYAVWAALVSLAIFRYRLLDLAPIAREALIEMLSDGVIVLDALGRVVDANPQALTIFGWPRPPIGEFAEQTMGGWIDRALLDGLESTVKKESSRDADGAVAYYNLTVSVLREKYGQTIGFLILVHDISEQKAVEKELAEMSLLDELTGLSNRRGFKLLAGQLIGMANRTQLNAALFYMDIDQLKWINDQLGHTAGDLALQDAANILKNSFRSSDILARFGGDEFVVLALESRGTSAATMAEHLRENLERHGQLDRNFQLSFSTGVAHYAWDRPKSIEILLEEADRAMYAMKQANRMS